MDIEKTTALREIEGFSRANEYLAAGWILLNHYLTDNGIPGMGANQQTHYVLAWQQIDKAPIDPPLTTRDYSDGEL